MPAEKMRGKDARGDPPLAPLAARRDGYGHMDHVITQIAVDRSSDGSALGEP